MIRTIAVLLLMFSGSAMNAFAADDRSVVLGQQLAETNCANCHSIMLDGESPHTDAPPFRRLHERFPVETIDEALLAGAWPDHADMPHFTMTPRQAGNLAAYIATLQPVVRGQRLVEANCAECHAISSDDESPHKQALPFRVLSQLYPIIALEEAFAEGIVVGHPDMPEFIAEPDQIEAILSYIESIQE